MLGPARQASKFRWPTHPEDLFYNQVFHSFRAPCLERSELHPFSPAMRCRRRTKKMGWGYPEGTMILGCRSMPRRESIVRIFLELVSGLGHFPVGRAVDCKLQVLIVGIG